MTITGTFANGSRLLAIPHYARQNQLPPPSQDPAPVEGERPPPNSIVWIRES
jgi:hypothetical protein